MSIEAYMIRILVFENFVDILKMCIQRRLLIDIVLVMDDVGGIYPETCTGGTFGSTYD